MKTQHGFMCGVRVANRSRRRLLERLRLLQGLGPQRLVLVLVRVLRRLGLRLRHKMGLRNQMHPADGRKKPTTDRAVRSKYTPPPVVRSQRQTERGGVGLSQQSRDSASTVRPGLGCLTFQELCFSGL